VSKINDGGQAFPRPHSECSHARCVESQRGMSLRDYFAAKAIELWASCDDEDAMAEWAYKAADAMLKAREGK
jgi:hypothetical protein